MKVCFVSKDQTIQNHSLQYTLLFDLNLCIPAEEEVIVPIIKECLLLCFRIYSIPETFKGKPLSQRGKKILYYILEPEVHLLQISSTLALLWSCWSRQASNCSLVSLSSNPFTCISSTTSLVFCFEETVSSLFTLGGSAKDLGALDRKWLQVASAQRAKVRQTRPSRVLQPSITVIELRQ